MKKAFYLILAGVAIGLLIANGHEATGSYSVPQQKHRWYIVKKIIHNLS